MKKLRKVSKAVISTYVIMVTLVGNFAFLPQKASAADIPQYSGGILVYADTATVGTPKYKVFDDATGFGSEQSAASVGASAINWIRVAASPTADEYIIVTRDAANVIKAQICTGNSTPGVSCGSPTTITATAGTHGLRNFDIAYEQTSGDALIVYGTATADELRKVEKANGSSSWTNDAAITTTRTTGTVEWVELESRRSSNEIGIAYSDSNDDISAYKWSGTAAGNEPTAAITTAGVTGDVRKFDVSFEGTSGDMLVVAALTTADAAYGTLSAAGTWNTLPATEAAVDFVTAFVDLSNPNPSDNEIVVSSHGAAAASNPSEGYVYNGTAFTDGTAGDDVFQNWAANYQLSATSYMSTTYYGVTVHSSSATADDIDWWTVSSAGAITDQTVNARTRGASRFIDLFDYPNANKVLLITADANSDLWADSWDGAAVTNVAWTDRSGGSALETDLSIATKDVVDFAFRLAAAAASAPTVTTQAASSIAATSATLNGNITDTGGASATVRGFAYGTDSTLSAGVSTTTENGTFGTGAYTGSASSLTCNTTYYFRPYATNTGGTGYGTITSFTTSPCVPTVTTQAASSIAATSATLNGNITDTGGASATVRGFAYSTDSTLSTGVSTTTENGTFGTGAFTGSASSLSCNTTYYFRPYATNSAGTGYGTITSFTTSPCSPTVTTQAASSLTQTSATLNGNITATGGASATVRGFAWGTNLSLSNGDTATTTENGTFGTGAFTGSLSSLACNTTYYFRPYATNSGGTGLGTVTSFTTSPCNPTVTTQAASSVTATSATLNGNITVTGGASATVRGFAYGTSATLATVISTTTENGTFSTGAFTGSASSLSCNTTYYFRPYATNSGGTGYGTIVSFTTSACVTTLGDGSDPSSSTIGPSYAVTDIDQFTFQTNSGSDSITALTVQLLPANSYNNIAKVEVTNTSNIDVCTDVDNPSSNSLSFTGCSISAGTSPTTFKIRITPKTHANMPAVPGASYAVTATTTAWTGSYSQAGTDTDSATITVDNASPSSASNFFGYDNSYERVDFSWNTTNEAATSTVLRWASGSAGAEVPAEGSVYSLGATIGTATVVCQITNSSPGSFILGTDGFIDGPSNCLGVAITNGQAYTYKVFQQDAYGNYDAGVSTTLTPNQILNFNPSESQVAELPIPYPDRVIGAFLGYVNGGSTSMSSIGFTVNDSTGLSGVQMYSIDTPGGVCSNADPITNGTLFNASPAAFSGNKATLTGNLTISNSFKCFYVVMDVGAAASDNQTLEVSVESSSDISLSSGIVGSLPANMSGTTVLKLPTFDQKVYKFFENSDSTGVGAAIGSSNSPQTLSTVGQAFRLRTLVRTSTVDLYTNGATFKLQFASKDLACDSGSYSDVTSGTAIAFKDNATPADGSTLTANASDPTDGAVAIVNQTYEEANNFTNSQGIIASGQDGKWDFSLYDNGAPGSTTYCFRIVKSDGTALTYTVYPEITTASAGTPDIQQLHYRWRNDDGSESAATYAAGEDSGLTSGIFPGDRKRLRLVISNAGTGSASSIAYRLEHASTSCSVWQAVPSIGQINSEHWVMDLSSHFTDSAITTDLAGLSNPGGKTFTAGLLKSSGNEASALTLTNSQFTEMEFSVRSTANATVGTTYCFRLTNAGSTSNFTYSVQPQVILSAIASRPSGGGGGGSSSAGAGGEQSGSGPAQSGGNSSGGGSGSNGNAGGESNGGGGNPPAQGGGNQGGGGGGGAGGGDLGLFWKAPNIRANLLALVFNWIR